MTGSRKVVSGHLLSLATEAVSYCVIRLHFLQVFSLRKCYIASLVLSMRVIVVIDLHYYLFRAVSTSCASCGFRLTV